MVLQLWCKLRQLHGHLKLTNTYTFHFWLVLLQAGAGQECDVEASTRLNDVPQYVSTPQTSAIRSAPDDHVGGLSKLRRAPPKGVRTLARELTSRVAW